MEIKSTKGYLGQLLFCGVLLGVLDIVFLLFEGATAFFVFLSILSFAFVIYAMRLWVAYGRTFLFDKNGCTVIFGRYRKHYAWRDLKAIQYKNSGRRIHYARTEARPDTRLVFLQKGRRLPRTLGIESYCIFFYPLSFVFVGFLNSDQANSTLDRIYIAPEKEFLEKLKEWNVEVYSEMTV